jgi:hypothetical protein
MGRYVRSERVGWLRNSGLEYVPPKLEDSQMVGGSFNPVHVYLLVEQGVHILEFNNLENWRLIGCMSSHTS